MRDEEVDAARLHLAPLADPDGGQHRDQDQHHGRCKGGRKVRKNRLINRAGSNPSPQDPGIWQILTLKGPKFQSFLLKNPKMTTVSRKKLFSDPNYDSFYLSRL